EPARRRLGPRVCNAGFLSIYSGQPTSTALNERQRRTSRATADIEDVACFPYSKKFRNLGLLGSSAPALLPNVFAEDFTPQVSGDVAPEGSVLDGVKVGALFGHYTLLQPTASTSVAK